MNIQGILYTIKMQVNNGEFKIKAEDVRMNTTEELYDYIGSLAQEMLYYCNQVHIKAVPSHETVDLNDERVVEISLPSKGDLLDALKSVLDKEPMLRPTRSMYLDMNATLIALGRFQLAEELREMIREYEGGHDEEA